MKKTKAREGTASQKSPAGEWQSHAWKAGLQGEARDPDQALSLRKPQVILRINFFLQLKSFDFKES